jgi:phenylalanyl-tRNA synthetase alpha subunit
LFDSIREALPALGNQNAQEDSIEIEEALDKYEKLEQMIEYETKRSKKNESRIKKLISLKDKYRKRTNYLELHLNENDLTELREKAEQRKANRNSALTKQITKLLDLYEVTMTSLNSSNPKKGKWLLYKQHLAQMKTFTKDTKVQKHNYLVETVERIQKEIESIRSSLRVRIPKSRTD